MWPLTGPALILVVIVLLVWLGIFAVLLWALLAVNADQVERERVEEDRREPQRPR